MNDSTLLPPSHLAPSRRQYRTSSQSPTRHRHTDDLISHLSPRTALEAFRNPSGALKECMDAATPTEQAFAVRTALASKKIHEWLEELLAWPWPAGRGAAGFELPPAKRRKLSAASDGGHVSDPDNEDNTLRVNGRTFVGWLQPAEVARYDERIDEIGRGMEEVDVEGIKAHVLHNHIMPLSRPGTPMSESTRSVASSMSSYTKMDDMTALVTATIVQALPNLSKLTRLMNVWNTRLLVLRRRPVFMSSLADAELALQSGWNAIELGRGQSGGRGGVNPAEVSTLSRKDFEIMRLVLGKKVSKAGRDLDGMLDVLEASEDTLPEDWIDRMDAVERGYGEWVAACERKIREADWARMVQENRAARMVSPEPETQEEKVHDDAHIESDAPAQPSYSQEAAVLAAEAEIGDLRTAREAEREEQGHDEEEEKEKDYNDDAEWVEVSEEDAIPDTEHAAELHSSADLDRERDNKTPKAPDVVIKIHPAEDNSAMTSAPREVSHEPFPREANERVSSQDKSVEGENRSEDLFSDLVAKVDEPTRPEPTQPMKTVRRGGFDGSEDVEPEASTATSSAHPDPSDSYDRVSPIGGVDAGQLLDHEPVSETAEEDGGHVGGLLTSSPSKDAEHTEADDDFEDILDFVPRASADTEATPEPELPPLPQLTRRGSDASEASTVIHGMPIGVGDFSSDLPDYGTPDLPRIRDIRLDGEIPSDDVSPPSSPPAFRLSTRSAASVTFNDMPTVAEAPDDETPPKTPVDSSMMEDVDTSRDLRSPSRMSEASTDDQLQQQISEILESIPAKIRLTNEPPTINLNPPDFSLPRTRNRPDPTPRSHSSLSSRAGTPSFTLAPARNSRPRHQRGNQEIKLYHLSRSTGENPIKLFIRLVGENGERVMVRVGGGWADLGEYLKEYATHHGRRSGGAGGEASKVEVKDLLPRVSTGGGIDLARPPGSSPPSSRPVSAMDSYSPITPLSVRKTRKSVGEDPTASSGPGPASAKPLPKTPLAASTAARSSDTPSSGEVSTRSRSSSRLSWTEEDSSLGMAGPRARNVEMSEESRAWVESVKEKVRLASGDQRKASDPLALAGAEGKKFGDMGKVGGTKRLFRKGGGA